MDCNAVKPHLRIRTVKLGDTKGMFIKPRHLDCRREGVIGTVLSYVPGHGGDVWFVQHDGSDEIGAYVFDEMELAPVGSIPQTP